MSNRFSNQEGITLGIFRVEDTESFQECCKQNILPIVVGEDVSMDLFPQYREKYHEIGGITCYEPHKGDNVIAIKRTDSDAERVVFATFSREGFYQLAEDDAEYILANSNRVFLSDCFEEISRENNFEFTPPKKLIYTINNK